MRFFKKLGQTAVHIGLGAAYRVKAAIQIGKINAMINKEEKTIQNLYLDIGKAYTHGADSAGNLEGMVASAQECEQRIADGEKQKRALRRVQCCEKCGAEISETMAFCTICGNAMPVVEERAVCVHCGSSVPQGMRFCTECGKPMPGTVVEEMKTIKVCPSCGAKLKKKNAFCTECGTKIN